MRAFLAGRIISLLDGHKLTGRPAHEVNGIAGADVTRIRKTKFKRHTIDRLMAALVGVGKQVEVTVSMRPRNAKRAPLELRS